MSVRMIKGDALDCMRRMPAESFDLIVADPPYSGMNRHLKLGKGRIVGERAAGETDTWFQEWFDDPDDFGYFLAQCRRVLRPGSHIYMMFDPYSLLTLGAIMREYFDVKGIVTWDKVNIGMGHYFRRRSEFIVFATTGGKAPLTNKATPDIWSIKRIGRPEYPTQKPVELFERMMQSSLAGPGDVLDPFFGSGSSAIAAMNLGHRYVGIDSSDKAHEIARRRVQEASS